MTDPIKYAAQLMVHFDCDKRAAIAAIIEAVRDKTFAGFNVGYAADVIEAIYAMGV